MRIWIDAAAAEIVSNIGKEAGIKKWKNCYFGWVSGVIDRHYEQHLADAVPIDTAKLLDEAQAEQRRLEAACTAMRDALLAWQQWEAAVIMDPECWGGHGMAPFPTLTQKHLDALTPLQYQRKAALAMVEKQEKEKC
jgi:hypothetical protein